MAIINPPMELREKLGDAATDALVVLINQADGNVKEDVITLVEEKFERRLAGESAKTRGEIAALDVKITQVKSDLEVKITQVKSDLEVKITQVKSDLEVKIAQSKSELIRWMFIFWAGQIAVLTGLLFAFFK
ncbi:MAG: hypothetical protein AB1742_02905 [bacterium]